MKRNLFRRIAALALTLALCAGGASAAIADFAIEQPTVYEKDGFTMGGKS